MAGSPGCAPNPHCNRPEEVTVDQTSGVRQGSPDSPVLFAARVAETLEKTFRHMQQGGTLPFLPPTPGFVHGQYTHLGGKTQCTCNAHSASSKTYCGATAAHHQQQPTEHRDIDSEGADSNSRSRKYATASARLAGQLEGGARRNIVAEMSSRARTAYAQNRKILSAGTPTTPRLQLHETLVRQSARWGCETWPVRDNLLKTANSQQLTQLRNDRGETETGGGVAAMEPEALRQARVLLHRSKTSRWSTHILLSIWRLWENVVRGGGVTKDLLLWRGLAFWRHEQRKPPTHGARRAGRFCSALDTERQIAAITGEDLPSKALDRQAWQELEPAFIEKYDLPWASGKQPQIANLA